MFSSKPKFIPGVPYEVQRIYDMLSPKPKELLHNASGRTFIMEGEVGVFNHKERRTKRRHLFLFNDILLITKKEGKKSHWLKVFVGLRSSLKIEDVLDSATRYKVEFRIYAPKKTIILFTQTNEEKVKWLREIRACITGVEEGTQKDAPAQVYESSPAPVTIGTDQKIEQKEKISGDIGNIEIPGFESDNTFGRIPAETEYPSDEELGVSPVITPQGVTILHEQALPPTPHSTPVSASSFFDDDFDSLVNRNAGEQQTTPNLGQTPTFDFFATTQTPAATQTPAIAQPFPFSSSSPLAPSGFPPSASAILQPTPANATPVFSAPMTPVQAPGTEGFAALKSLDAQTQTQNIPQQFNFSTGLSIEEQMQQLSMQSPYYGN